MFKVSALSDNGEIHWTVSLIELIAMLSSDAYTVYSVTHTYSGIDLSVRTLEFLVREGLM